MTAARDLSKLGNQNAIKVDTTNTRLGVNSTSPDSTLDVGGEIIVGSGASINTAGEAVFIGVVTAVSYHGSGANLTGIAATDHVSTFDLVVAGISTFNDDVRVLAGGLDVVGVVTSNNKVVATGLDIGTAGVDIDGQTDLDELQVAGVSTFSAKAVFNTAYPSIDADNELQVGTAIQLGKAGILTALGLDISTGGVDIDGQTNLDELVVAGVSTFYPNRVAVGTDASPGYPLDVQQAIRIRHDGSNLGKVLFSGGGTRIQYSDSTGNLSFYTNSAERCYVGYGGGLYVSSGALTVTTHSALNTIVASGICTASKFDGPGNVPAGQTGTVTLAASDAGKHVAATGTVTLGTGIFAVGDAVTIYNNSAGGITITLSAVTCYNAADGTTGNRTLGARGLATILCTATNTYVISGAGLT